MNALYLATLETPSYTFEGTGISAVEAMNALKGATRVHALQCGLPANWAAEDLKDVAARALQPRQMLRDGHPITWPSKD